MKIKILNNKYFGQMTVIIFVLLALSQNVIVSAQNTTITCSETNDYHKNCSICGIDQCFKCVNN